MSNLPIFDIAGSALQAQSVRMSTLASNLSNADTIAGSADAVYKPLEPIFQSVTSRTDPNITTVQSRKSARATPRRSSATSPATRWPMAMATSTSPMSTPLPRWST